MVKDMYTRLYIELECVTLSPASPFYLDSFLLKDRARQFTSDLRSSMSTSWQYADEFNDAVVAAKTMSRPKIEYAAQFAIRNIRFYKYIVVDLERYLRKCPSNDRLAAAYLMDAIMKECRLTHSEPSLYQDRFAKNLQSSAEAILQCSSSHVRRSAFIFSLCTHSFQLFDLDCYLMLSCS